jgi:hypothetical protein
MSELKYLLIGDMLNKTIIGTHQTKSAANLKEIQEKAKNIFTNIKSFEKRSKLSHNSNIYYSTIVKNNIFLLAVATLEYDERLIYSLFEDIENQGVWKQIDVRTGELNNVGKQNLHILIEKYMDNNTNNSTNSDKLSRVNSEISEIRVEVKDGIKKMIHNSDIIKNMDMKADRIKDSSLIFKRDSVNLNKALWWRNMRTKVFLACLILAVIGYLIYLIFF